MQDLRAVMDAAGSERAALFGLSEGGPMSMLFAATYPERVSALVLYGTFARMTQAEGYPWGYPPQVLDRFVEAKVENWGGDNTVDFFAPSVAGDAEFRRLEAWLPKITTWADHDGLVYYLIGPMVADEQKRAKRLVQWAKHRNRWFRRAAAVALVPATRKQQMFDEVIGICNALLADDDDMVQKGVGWLLRETAKANSQRTVAYLMQIRESAPRLVLRTACETLPPEVRLRILATQSR